MSFPPLRPAAAALALAFATVAGTARGDEPKPRVALQIDAKLPVAVAGSGVTYNPTVPQAAVGIRYARVSAQLAFGFSRSESQLSTSSDSDPGLVPATSSSSQTTILFAPTFTIDLWRAADRRASLYLLVAALLGGIFQSQTSSSNGGTTSTDHSSDHFAGGFQAAIGAHAALHPNFWLGIEMGPAGLFYTLDATFGGGSGYTTSESRVFFYAALAGTFRLGE